MCSTLPDFSEGIDKNLSLCKWGMVRPSLCPVKGYSKESTHKLKNELYYLKTDVHPEYIYTIHW